jgi:hypothetical protein
MTAACKEDGILRMSKLPQNQYKGLFHLVEILTLDLSRLLVGSHRIKELLTILVFFIHMKVLNCCSFFPIWVFCLEIPLLTRFVAFISPFLS